MRMGDGAYWMTIRPLTFEASRVVPLSDEISPFEINILPFFRIS